MEHQPDRIVVEAVQTVRDSLGPDGLRDLVALAQTAIRETEAAVQRLAEAGLPPGDPAEADTQTWKAFVAEGERDSG